MKSDLSHSKFCDSNAVVLLSGGLDSSVNFVKAVKEFSKVYALTFDYGQASAPKEIQRSQQLCDVYKVSHKVLDLSWLSEMSHSSLHNQQELPRGDEVQIKNQEQSQKTAQAVWVSNRNGIFLNVAAAYAEYLKADYIVPGFNLEEAQTFPDNSADFLKAIDQSLSFSTSHQVKTYCFTTQMNKTEIYRLGEVEGLDLHLVWPCYLGDRDEICRECESCKRFIAAQSAAHM